MINGSNGDMKIHKNLQIVDEFKIGLQGSFKINGVSQWKMIHEEFGTNFDLDKWKLTNSGAMLKITECGGFHLLGGYGQLSMHKLSTTISLDGYEFDHIKIDARFHFIDAWSGHTAYVKVPSKNIYLWTDSFDFTQTKNSLNLCGSDIGEGKFVSLIESVLTKEQAINSEGDLELEIGTTLDTDPEYASYGISSLRIYIR